LAPEGILQKNVRVQKFVAARLQGTTGKRVLEDYSVEV